MTCRFFSYDKDAAIAEFKAAASQQRDELQDLLACRDLREHPPTDLVGSDVLAPEGQLWALGGYPEGMAILCYSHDGGELKIWLLKEGEIAAAGHGRIAVAELQSSLANLGCWEGSRGRRDFGGLAVASPDPVDPAALSALTRLLLPETVVQALRNVKHLVVVPTLSIGTAPFALLGPVPDGQMVVDAMSVSIAPSLYDLYQEILAYSFLPGDQATVVGNPTYSSSLAASLAPLPGAEMEARKVAELLGCAPLLGPQATEENVAASAALASVLHLATHGVVDEDAPLDGSFLALAEGPESDGRWTAREIQELRLSAGLVVLSACNTALGKAHLGGIIGLARAFQLAGVPRVIVSLWPVDDQATVELMTEFYCHVRGGVFAAEALRRAMLAVRKRRQSPLDWAAFTLFGTPR